MNGRDHEIFLVPGDTDATAEPTRAAVAEWTRVLDGLPEPTWICHATYRRPCGVERVQATVAGWIGYLSRRCPGMEVVSVVERGEDGRLHVHAVVGGIEDGNLLRRSWSYGLAHVRRHYGNGDHGLAYVARKLAAGRPAAMTASAIDGRNGTGTREQEAPLDPDLPPTPQRGDQIMQGNQIMSEVRETYHAMCGRDHALSYWRAGRLLAHWRAIRLHRIVGSTWSAMCEAVTGRTYAMCTQWMRVARAMPEHEAERLGVRAALRRIGPARGRTERS